MKKIIGLALCLMMIVSTSSFAVEACHDCTATDGKNGYDCTEVVVPCAEFQKDCGVIDLKCPVTIKVCDCADVDAFKKDTVVGFEFTSLTPGFYFHDSTFPTNFLYIEDGSTSDDLEAPLCTEFIGGIPAVDLPGSEDWKNWLFSTKENGSDSVEEGEFTDSYYRDCDLNSNQKYVKAITANGADAAGYKLAGDEGVWWAVDVPDMVLDADDAAVSINKTVQVKIVIRQLDDTAGICTDCKIVCECIVDLFTYCPDSDYTESHEQIMFPYVLNGISETSGWTSGIAVSNTMTNKMVAIEDMEAVFVYYDATGQEFKGTIDDFDTIVAAWTFESLASKLDWKDVAPGAGVLRVAANFDIDGYQFNLSSNSAGIFGSAINPRRSNENPSFNAIALDSDE